MGLLGNLESAVSALPPEQLETVLRQLEELRYNRLALYTPYPKQRDFHEAGRRYRERLLRAGNQCGKTLCGAAEVAYHLTGDYPPWWVGRRWDAAIRVWAGGKDSLTLRDSVGVLLLGPPGERGTGFIPKDKILDIAPARGVADGVDYVTVAHVSGGQSRLAFKSYDQGRERWQAATLELVWFDEEPPAEIYTEGLTRTNATGGCVFMTFTPLLGMSEVVRRFLTEESPDRHDTNMTIEDAEHIPPDERARIIASYPPHEREARTKGVPILGSGRIFPIEEAALSVEPFQIPRYWALIGAMDFGWDHPFAAVKLAYDTQGDVVYVTQTYRAREETPILHVRALRAWGSWLPWAWPHDGLQHSKDSGEPLAKQYRSNGLKMLGSHAAFSDGSAGVEAGIFDMLERMQTGRLKVFSHLNDWWEEFRLYHRKEGKVVKEHDDLMAATRYGIMELRHSLIEPGLTKRPKPEFTDPLAAYRTQPQKVWR